MRLSQRVVRACVVGILALSTVLFSGCLNSEEAILGRYDAAKDEFVFLNLYQRISAQKPVDAEYLYALWQNRDHLITPPIPTIFTKTSVLRISPTEFAVVNLGESSKAIDATLSPVSLDAITVKPGKFFKRGGDAVCYYDQIVVPGKTIDQLLDAIQPEARKSIVASIRAEADRRKNGGKVWGWDDFRKLRLKDVRGGDDVTKSPDAKPGEEPSDDVIQYLSAETLDALTKGVTDGTAKISRKGPVFTMVVPGSEADVKAVVGIVQDMRTEAATLLQKGTAGKDVGMAKKLTDPIAVRAASPTVLELSIDVTELFKAMEDVKPPAAALEPSNEETTKGTAAVMAVLKEKGVPVDATLTVDQILAQFKDGTLPANPSEKPVKPGEGMVIAVKEEGK